MPPRKEKKKQASDAIAPATVLVSNSVKLDTRPVQPAELTDDHALKIEQLNAALLPAKIGIGKINNLKLENKLIFGVYNDRPENTSEINKMVTSFEFNGIQAFSEPNALPIIIDRLRLSSDQMFDGEWDQRNTLMQVEFSDTEPIVLASGQHRVAALRKLQISYLDEDSSLSKRLKELENLKEPTKDDAEEHSAVRKKLATVKGHINIVGEWGVILYDQDILLADGTELAHHLSRNQNLHVYKETAEEVIVATFRTIGDEYKRAREEAALKVLEDYYSRPTHKKASNITRVLKNQRLVMTLAMDLHPMGSHYRCRRKFTVRWLGKSISVTMGMYSIYMSTGVDLFRRLASKDAFPSYKLIDTLITRSLKDDATMRPLWLNKLADLCDEIVNGTPGDPKIFIPYLTDIDDSASQCFRTYKGTFGTWNSNYLEALKSYEDQVHTALHDGWILRSESLEDKEWLDVVLARILLWLTPIPNVHMPMPLMTGMVMDKVHNELEAVKLGYTEMSDLREINPSTHANLQMSDFVIFRA
ncbi:hypothetical protein DEU56DRAFT_912648 [Suillus clintonianus]|uniref:uncharacterized protein n=1 Tax=Suillus clintonianus TaxID=1904413 RepID=UPI001B865AE8|nr:uncharacterized protein DEU56DRAFT_912648 [Suillus clintonianus]KAG2138022.1 hypothetical protein DEU56DRAFT_912648 [Suillus clintonianus]